MKRVLLGTFCSILAVGVEASEPTFDADLSLWGGYFDYEEDHVDVSQKHDSVYGIGADLSTDRSKKLYGTLSFDYEHTTSKTDDNDQTISYTQLAYIQHIGLADHSWAINPYLGYGVSKDNGDNDDDTMPYRFAGLGITKTIDKFEINGQLGMVDSDDNYGEAIENGVYGGLSVNYQLNDQVALTGRMFGLKGDRDDDPTAAEAFDVAAGVEYSPSVHPVTFWANYDYSSYNPDESDTPNISEVRIGLTYHFGNKEGITSRRYLPNIGRWMSLYMNEIE
ncbi:hypothetical protein [Amphritea sp. HPY]|uniref:hypothetical protein n=1 Tax=Amphritea sp. HPY TaxID=3421652 RepID=UPI003D7D3376